MSNNEADMRRGESSKTPTTQLSYVDLYRGGSLPGVSQDYARADIDVPSPKAAPARSVGFYHVDAGSQYLDPAGRFQVDPRGQYRVTQSSSERLLPPTQIVDKRAASAPVAPPVVSGSVESQLRTNPPKASNPFQQPTILDQYLAPKQPTTPGRGAPVQPNPPSDSTTGGGLDPAAQREAENRRRIMEARREQQGVRERLAKEAEERRKNDIEESKRYVPKPIAPAPPFAAPPVGRARFGVPTDLGRTLDNRNQQDRREVDRIEEGARPLAPAQPGGRARFGVDPGAGRVLSEREQEMRRDVDKREENLRPADTTPRPQQPVSPYQPRPLPTDGTQWQPPAGSTRTFKDKLDFDKDSKQVQKSVQDYLGKNGPKPRAAGDPTRPGAPQDANPLSIDGQLRRFGDWVRGK